MQKVIKGEELLKYIDEAITILSDAVKLLMMELLLLLQLLMKTRLPTLFLPSLRKRL